MPVNSYSYNYSANGGYNASYSSQGKSKTTSEKTDTGQKVESEYEGKSTSEVKYDNYKVSSRSSYARGTSSSSGPRVVNKTINKTVNNNKYDYSNAKITNNNSYKSTYVYNRGGTVNITQGADSKKVDNRR